MHLAVTAASRYVEESDSESSSDEEDNKEQLKEKLNATRIELERKTREYDNLIS